jgi:hypothetical protein
LLEPEIRTQLHELDSDMPFAQVQTIDELVERQTGGQRFTTVLLASFAVAGLALAVVGLYGVVSFLVAQRKQEMAVRMALGASRAKRSLARTEAQPGEWPRLRSSDRTVWRMGIAETYERPAVRRFTG